MSEKYTPRRAQPPAKSKRGPIAIGVAVALLAGGIGGYYLLRNGGLPSGTDSPSPSPVVTCPAPAAVVVDPDYLALAEGLAASYGAQFGASCQPLDVSAQPSVQVAQAGLGTADAWLPEDTSWVQRASGAGADLAAATTTPIATTPLVLVYEQQVRDAMGDERQNGENLVAMLTEAKQYDAYDQPWGTIKLVEPDPNTSAVGALGFMTMATMLSNGEPPPSDTATATENQQRMAAAEQRVFERVATSAEVLTKLATNPADDTVRGPAGPRTGLTTEFAALSAVRSGAQIAAEHLGDGATGVELSVVNPGDDPTVQGWVDWLTSPAGRTELAAAGLRAGDSVPSEADLAAAGLATAALPAQRPNQGQDVAAATMLQAGFAQRASVLTVLDLSGSMGAPFGDSGVRRVDVVTQAAVSSWSAWPLGYSSGLMTFSADEAGTPHITTTFPLLDNRSPEWKTQMPLFQQSLAELEPLGGTPLYQAIWDAYSYNLANYQDGKLNKVIVLTDGVDEAHNSPMTQQQLISQLPATPDPEQPIEMIYVLIGPDADYPAVEQIAAATSGTAIWVRDINELPAVMQGLLAG